MIFNYEPWITEDEINSLQECIRLGIASPFHIKDAQNKLSKEYKRNCLLTSSGTAAIHAALLSLGIGKGDEIICPDLTFAATWNVIEYVGAKPIFVDVDPKTWCIDYSKIESKINKKTKAIITVDLFGNPCNYEKIKEISIKNNIHLIQDAAESLGSKYKNSSVFHQGDISCTSFNLNKIVTSCGGGAIFSNDSKIIEECKSLCNQSKKGLEYDYFGVGYNYRMGSINAAILMSQISRIEEILKKKKEIKSIYQNLLSDQEVVYQKPNLDSVSNEWVVVARFKDRDTRDNIHKNLIENRIESKLIFKPASSIEWLQKKYNINPMTVSSSIFSTSLILPSSTKISKSQIERVCKVIKRTL
jgi:perosamine synthetase